MDSVLQDLRYALRKLSGAPAFTAAAVLSIAIGIAANTTIFSLVNGVLLRPLPGLAAPERLLEIGRTENGSGSDTFSFATLEDLRRTARSAEVAGWTFGPLAIAGEREPAPVVGMQVTDNYFEVLGVSMALGRGLAEGESWPQGSAAVAVISHMLWQTRFDSDERILGREVRVNGTPAVVIGVTEPGFQGQFSFLRVDAWVPLGMVAAGLADEGMRDGRRNSFVFGVGRLREGYSIDEAGSEMASLMEALVERHPDDLAGQGAVVNRLGSIPLGLLGRVRAFMMVLMAVVGLVLCVACVNVAGMLLARGINRSREVAVRRALGAGQGRLLRQLLTESLVLFMAGGVSGVVAALWATRLLLAFDPPIPPPFDVRLALPLDVRVLGFSLALTLATGLLFGLGPALRASRPELVPALKSEIGAGGQRTRARRLLVAAQVAMTVLLVVGSGLFLRALDSAASVPLGFDPDGVYALAVDFNMSGYEPEAATALSTEIRDQVRGVAGVEEAAFVVMLPLGLPSNMSFGGVSRLDEDPSQGRQTSVNVVSPGYFDVLQLPLMAGADFSPADAAGSERVVIVNQRLAHELWGQRDPVGQRLRMGGLELTVKGVAADAKYSTLTEEATLFAYLPLGQQYMPSIHLLVRDRGTEAGVAAVRAAVQAAAPDLPVTDVTSLRDYVEIAFLPQRVAATIAGVLGAVAMVLAAVGMYGVTAQGTLQRGREIGVRIAIGASRRDVLALIVRQGMAAPLLGMAVGFVAAALVTRLLTSLLFGVSPLDIPTFAAVFLLLTTVALVAAWLPGRWAASIDPVRALRSD